MSYSSRHKMPPLFTEILACDSGPVISTHSQRQTGPVLAIKSHYIMYVEGMTRYHSRSINIRRPRSELSLCLSLFRKFDKFFTNLPESPC